MSLYCGRACSSYLFWQSEVRSKFKEDNPDATISDLAKLMGVAWGKLTPEDKHKYDQMAARDKERYQKEKAEWNPGSGELFCSCNSVEWSR